MLAASHQPQLWAIKDLSNGQPMLGCSSCPERRLCGGLHVTAGGAQAIDCMGMCRCQDPAKCDVVCPAAPSRYWRRIIEVHGLDLEAIPVARVLPLPTLPEVALLLEGNIGDGKPSRAHAFAAVPLSMTVAGGGRQTRAKTRKELEQTFGVAPRDGWIASGVEKDSHVERMWRLPTPRRTWESLKRAGVIFATTPNFSTYADVPRHDNLHAMMRIAWTWYEMVESGLPTALHINGRTDHDFVRWGQFAKRQPGLRAVAFEFLTGAEPKEDGRRYVDRLRLFAQESARKDLRLVLRSGASWVLELREHFKEVMLIDSGPYFKTIKRQRQEAGPNGTPVFRSHKTVGRAEMHALFLHNAKAKLAIHAGLLRPGTPTQGALSFEPARPTRSESAPAMAEVVEQPQLDLFEAIT